MTLGTNTIEDCDAAIVADGVEIFRFRNRDNDGKLVVDFDVRGSDGKLLFKIAKNQIVSNPSNYEYHSLPDESYVTDSDGKKVVHVIEHTSGHIEVIGDFYVGNHHISITKDALSMGGVLMTGNKISGFNKAIVLNSGSFAIGSS